jgi:hypothetical protein
MVEEENNTISEHLINNHGFSKIRMPRSMDKIDIDRFSCMKRIHVLHYLFYSDIHKHFSIGVFNESRKGIAGGGYKDYNTVMIPKTVVSTAQADEMVKAISNE